MAYTFTIESKEELEAIAFIADRYYYAAAIWEALNFPEDFSPEDGPYPVAFEMAEHEAWVIQSAVEAEDSWLPCMGSRLCREVAKLLESIV